LGLARRLLAFSVSLAVVLSSYGFAIALPKIQSETAEPKARQVDSQSVELQLTSSSATPTKTGVLLRWSINAVADNLGFNVYRLNDGQRTRVNREMIPGALFAPGTPALRRGGYSFSWLDREGSANSTYFIESVNVNGAATLHGAISPVASKSAAEFELGAAGPSATESTDTFVRNYPAEEVRQPAPASGTLQDQWAIAAQTALKIAIKKDGWYRVTQPQMVAAGFNPTVDIRNLRLYVDANEVAINTNQLTGQFGSGDYIEFYGRGLDIPTTDKRIYYLIAGTSPGKRVGGEIQLDGDPVLPPAPTSTPPPQVLPPGSVPPPGSVTPASPRPVLRDPIFSSWAQDYLNLLLQSSQPSDQRETKEPDASRATDTSPNNANADRAPVNYSVDVVPGDAVEQPAPVASTRSASKSTVTANTAASATPAPKLQEPSPQPAAKVGARLRKHSRSRRGIKRRIQRQPKQEHSHALAPAGLAPANFAYTTELKERLVYLSNLLNGDEENFFGRVISTTPVNQTLTVSNPDLTATGPATLEFALQGVQSSSGAIHDVSVAFNGITIGSLSFFPLEHPVRTFSIPMSQLQNGSNTLTFTKTSTGEVCIVDYLKLTYPHAFKADTNSLKFNLRGSQTLKVDGFSVPTVRMIDYTDPLNVRITKPASETSATGYAITVPRSEPFTKDQRLLYTIPYGQFDQPAALSLSTPSTLNANSNAASFLVVSNKNFIPRFTANVSPVNTSLVAQRQAQGFVTKVVDIDDVFDEFSYGVHGPQAIRDFLQYAATHWATPPRYIIFAGDSSLDPRNYQGNGDFDFVPTKLVDATYNETCSDDWLTDFDNDGVADIPIGRLPFRTTADAALIISKIVNFVPQASQSALLIADQDEFNIFGFAATNDSFQSLLPASMAVQRVNRAPQPSGVPTTEPDSQVRTDIIAGFNQGRALVNYSGHGNVDVWTGASLFTTGDALGLTNGNNLSFVVVMDCLNGYFQDPNLLSLGEAFLKAPGGGAVAAFASSGLTIAQGQHDMGHELYTQLYGATPIALGDAIKIAKGATFDIDVKRTWIYFGDPSIKIR